MLNSVTTAVAGTVYTAARRNAEVRDNLNDIESSGRIFVSRSQIAFGGAVDAANQVTMRGTFTPPTGSSAALAIYTVINAFAGSDVFGALMAPTLVPAVNRNAYGLYVAPTMTEAGSGAHPLIAGARFDAPTINTAGGATTTKAATVYIAGAPTGAGTNYALEVASGTAKFNAAVIIDGVVTVNGFGNHAFNASGAGANAVSVVNTAAGTANQATFAAAADGGLTVQMTAFSSTFTTSGPHLASGASLYHNGVGGVSVAALSASGGLRFYSGGTTKRGEFLSDGRFVLGNTSSYTGKILQYYQRSNTPGTTFWEVYNNASTAAWGFRIDASDQLVFDRFDGASWTAKATFSASGSLTLGDNLTVSGGVIIAAANTDIRRNTDAGFIRLVGGSAVSQANGPIIELIGNTYSGGAGGYVSVYVGNVAGSMFRIMNSAGSQMFSLLGGNGSMQFNASTGDGGDWRFNSTHTNGGAIQILHNGTAVVRFGSRQAVLGSGSSSDLIIHAFQSSMFLEAAVGIFSTRIRDDAGGTANVHIDPTTGRFLRVGSSLRYKDLHGSISLADSWRVTRGLQLHLYSDKSNPRRIYPGLVAEETDALEPLITEYDAKGRPDGVLYDRGWLFLVGPVRDLDRRTTRHETEIERLTRENVALKAQVHSLQERIH